MAFNGTMVWEVRPTVGSDSNGGGFDPGVTSPGTDYSQQTSPQVTYTDLVIGATTTQCTSAANPFTSAHVGNVINVTSGTGFTVQRVEILSVAAGVATCDKSLGTTASTGGHGALGGSLATVAAAPVSPSNTVWIRGSSGTLTVTSTLSLNVNSKDSPATSQPLTYIGYTSTRGDNGQATWTTSTNSIHLVTTTGGYNYRFQNIKFTNTAGTPGDGIHAITGNAENMAVVNCYFSGFLHGINSDYNQDFAILNLLVDSCEITACTGDGIISSTTLCVAGCYIHGNTGNGIHVSQAQTSSFPWGLVVYGSTIKSNAGTAGIYINALDLRYPVQIFNCNVINSSGDNIQITGGNSASPLAMWNCNIDSAGGYGVNYSNSSCSFEWGPSFRNNGYGSGSTANTSGDLHGVLAPVLAKGPGDFTYSGDPFVSRSTGNFALTTTGAGLTCTGAGYPTTQPG